MRVAFLVSLLALGGCSLFAGSEPIPFRSLVQSDTFVRSGSTEARRAVNAVIRSAAQEMAFRETYSTGAFPEPVDYDRSVVLGIALPSDSLGGVIDIREVNVENGSYSFDVETNGAVLLRSDRDVVAYPAHFVVIDRAQDAATRPGIGFRNCSVLSC